MALIALANSVSISAGPTVSVANVAGNTNTFRFLNANATGISYVGVFSNYADALTLNDAVNGDPSGAYGVPIAPNYTEIITGNFGMNPRPATVYVAAITSVSSGQQVIATPCRIVE